MPLVPCSPRAHPAARRTSAAVPECNSGGVAVLRALGGGTRSSSPAVARGGLSATGPISPGQPSTNSLAFRSVGAGGLRADSRKRAVRIDGVSMRRPGRRAGPVWQFGALFAEPKSWNERSQKCSKNVSDLFKIT
jgi:hypothetical protein